MPRTATPSTSSTRTLALTATRRVTRSRHHWCCLGVGSRTPMRASDGSEPVHCTAVVWPTAAGACDVDMSLTAAITVALKIDDDSGVGTIFVTSTRQMAPGTGTEDTESDHASRSRRCRRTLIGEGRHDVRSTPRAMNAAEAGAGATYVDIRLTDANNKGIALEAITIVSTRALLTTVTGTSDDLAMRTLKAGSVEEEVTLTGFTGASLAGSVTTTADRWRQETSGGQNVTGNDVDSSGYARVIVTGGGSPRYLHHHRHGRRADRHGGDRPARRGQDHLGRARRGRDRGRRQDAHRRDRPRRRGQPRREPEHQRQDQGWRHSAGEAGEAGGDRRRRQQGRWHAVGSLNDKGDLPACRRRGRHQPMTPDGADNPVVVAVAGIDRYQRRRPVRHRGVGAGR